MRAPSAVMAATITARLRSATVQERGSGFAGLRISSSTISTFLSLKQDFAETISQPASTPGRLLGELRKANASVAVALRATRDEVGSALTLRTTKRLQQTFPARDLAGDVRRRWRPDRRPLGERAAHVEHFQDVVLKQRGHF